MKMPTAADAGAFVRIESNDGKMTSYIRKSFISNMGRAEDNAVSIQGITGDMRPLLLLVKGTEFGDEQTAARNAAEDFLKSVTAFIK